VRAKLKQIDAFEKSQTQISTFCSDNDLTKMEKPKSTITPVVISDDKLQFLKKKLDDPNVSQFLKRDFI
jgi:hypothetical protein